MKERPLFRSVTGTEHTWQDDGQGGGVVTSRTDVAPILEWNKAAANHNDGYSPTRELRRVARVPYALIHKWLVEEGWDAQDPANAHKLARKLNDPEYRYLRTAPGRIGVSNGELR